MPDSSPRQLATSVSGQYHDPLALVDWAKLSAAEAWLPPSTLSLYGLPEFEVIGAEVQRRLSQYEFINVMYCGLWLESIFLQRVSRLLRPGMPRAEHAHLLHELREETGHSLMFLRAIEAGRLNLPQDSWRAPRTAALLGRFAPAGGALFWLAMLIGEHVSDSFNRHLCETPGVVVNPAIRQICLLHVADEDRHIAHARRMLAATLSKNSAARTLLSAAARVLLWQMASAFYYPPQPFYALAGLPRSVDWHAAARSNPARKQFVAQRLAATRDLLRSLGLKVD